MTVRSEYQLRAITVNWFILMPLLRLIKSVVEVALIYHKTLRDFNKNNWGG